jgi:hypothetical protein
VSESVCVTYTHSRTHVRTHTHTHTHTGVGPRTMWISIGGCVFFGAYEGSKKALGKILD